MGDFMTIGTITTGSLFTSPYGFIKSWNGANGRKEIVSGTERDKWNNYSMYRFESRCVESQAFPGYGLYASISDPPWSSIWTSQHEVALQSKLTSAVRQHDFNLAVNVAQGVQTVDMLVGNLKKLGKSFLALKHGNFADALRQLGTGQRPRPLKAKDIPGRWLELQYGWLPLISDTYEAVKAYSVLTEKARVSTVRVKKSVKGTFNGSDSPSNWTANGPYKYTKKIQYEMSDDISAVRSLGLADPLSVVWEILPYSFVVDWFLPIGSYLDNLSVIPTLKGRFCTVITKKYDSRTDPITSFYYVGASTVYSSYRMDRDPTTGISVAFPSFQSIPQAMSPKRVYNAIALASQVFLGKRR